jgi:hypothetical protein
VCHLPTIVLRKNFDQIHEVYPKTMIYFQPKMFLYPFAKEIRHETNLPFLFVLESKIVLYSSWHFLNETDNKVDPGLPQEDQFHHDETARHLIYEMTYMDITL